MFLVLKIQNWENWSGISFPTPLNQIDKFERNNEGLAVNVFGFEDSEVFPIQASEEVDGQMIDLLWLREGENTHFCCIKSLSRLISGQVSDHKSSVEICPRCLNPFPKESFKRHLESCGQFESVKIVLPEAGSKQSKLKFKNFKRKMDFPFVIFADFECRQELISSAQPNPQESFTEKTQKHIPCSFAFHLVSPFLKKDPVLFRAKKDSANVGEIFVKKLVKFIREVQKEFKFPKKMIFGDEEAKNFEEATKCWICEEDFEHDEKKVRDHCHFTGVFREAAHNSCNMQFRKSKFTPVFFTQFEWI